MLFYEQDDDDVGDDEHETKIDSCYFFSLFFSPVIFSASHILSLANKETELCKNTHTI